MANPVYKGSSAKPAMESKKFIAFLLTLVSLDGLTGGGMLLWLPLDQWSTIVLLALIVTIGVLSVGYIIGTVGLDALTHLFDTITPDSIFGKPAPDPVVVQPDPPPTPPGE